jgi:hypothetical protein
MCRYGQPFAQQKRVGSLAAPYLRGENSRNNVTFRQEAQQGIIMQKMGLHLAITH